MPIIYAGSIGISNSALTVTQSESVGHDDGQVDHQDQRLFGCCFILSLPV
ncbi:hypothetical protein [Polynucleobacter arcticus]|nr:hypothetical protein [Polynucleobacter arcticus]